MLRSKALRNDHFSTLWVLHRVCFARQPECCVSCHGEFNVCACATEQWPGMSDNSTEYNNP